MTQYTPILDKPTIDAVVDGAHSNLFSVLGAQPYNDGWVYRAFVPSAERLTAINGNDGAALDYNRIHEAGLFEVPAGTRLANYRLRAARGSYSWEIEDPYRFGPILTPDDEHYLSEGTHRALWKVLGARPFEMDGARGVAFAVWAPNAGRVSVVGDFNQWDGRRHVMRPRGATGVWEIFIPGLGVGEKYKYEIRASNGDLLPLKTDPVGFGTEHPPQTASIVRSLGDYAWGDGDWMSKRKASHGVDAPISIYEVHLPSWQRRPNEDNRMLSYHELANELVPYVKDMGFTHIEAMPVAEYPFDGSWGYQPVGLYAPTIRHGTPGEFRDFVQACHANDIGLILDWVPGHFPTDAHGLGKFDGTALYEHADPREGFHQDWNTLIYNYGRREVRNFLVANALYWFQEHHVDGLRVDAVASMLYRDYSRKHDEWVPNVHGGRENLEAISFMREVNTLAYGADPSIMTVAEESTAWPGVSKPVDAGGLGFGFKWNMGWMHDTLEYIQKDPIYRRYDHHKMTFGLHYGFSENFILPLSHDEVVHGKGSLLGRMPGNDWERFANLRAYYTFMWTHPGKKLLFMGGEFAQPEEWNHQVALPWHLLDDPKHAGIRDLIKDLNGIYRYEGALHRRDTTQDGFEWLLMEAVDESLYAWTRWGGDDVPPVTCVFNFTPMAREGFRLGVSAPGHWRAVLNSDEGRYGGGDRGNAGGVDTEPVAANGKEYSLLLNLPPLSGQIFVLQR